MKKFYTNILFVSLLIIVFNIIPKMASAQIDPGEDPDAPIDGGLSLFIAAGVAYGIKRAKENRKTVSTEKTNDTIYSSI